MVIPQKQACDIRGNSGILESLEYINLGNGWEELHTAYFVLRDIDFFKFFQVLDMSAIKWLYEVMGDVKELQRVVADKGLKDFDLVVAQVEISALPGEGAGWKEWNQIWRKIESLNRQITDVFGFGDPVAGQIQEGESLQWPNE